MDDPTAQAGGEGETVATVDEDMAAVFDRMEAEDAPAAEPETAPAAEPVPETTDTPEDGRDRDDKGRFTAKAGSDDAPPADTETIETTDQGTDVDPKPEVTPGLEAPASWSAPAKAVWNDLPPAAKEEIAKRENDVHRALEERANTLKGLEPIAAALEPVGERLRLSGVEPGQYVTQLVAADQFLQRDPVAAIQYLARAYGADLNSLNEPGDGEPVDPNTAALLGRVDQLENFVTTQANGVAANQHASAKSQIDVFQADPKHPHFQTVRKHMGVLMDTGQATDMEGAYDMAIWAHPEIRKQLDAARAVESEALRKKEAEKRASEAQRHTATNLSNGGAAGATPMTIDEELEATYNRMEGAA